MASIHYQSRGKGGWKLRFRDPQTKKQRVIWLGDTTETVAVETKAHVEHLLVVTSDELPPQPTTTKWLGKINDDLHGKLAKHNLVEGREVAEKSEIGLIDWIDIYIAERKDVKPSTIQTYEKARDSLSAFFGPNRKLRDITATEAKQWRIWMLTEGNRRTSGKDKSMAEETVRRRAGKVKQFFARLLSEAIVNPILLRSYPAQVAAMPPTSSL